MQTVSFQWNFKKANNKLHQYFWGSNNNFTDGGF